MDLFNIARSLDGRSIDAPTPAEAVLLPIRSSRIGIDATTAEGEGGRKY
ncbi:MAG: hypothetical protein JNL85_18505 [Rubrivivax sp.]|nr:hypothetical protein [Rubrivivax sp.]